MQLDWAEMPTRPKVAGRERRVYALVASLPYSGAQTAFFSFEMTIESFLERHARAFEWLEGVPRECVYDNLRSVVARRERDEVVWNPEPARFSVYRWVVRCCRGCALRSGCVGLPSRASS